MTAPFIASYVILFLSFLPIATSSFLSRNHVANDINNNKLQLLPFENDFDVMPDYEHELAHRTDVSTHRSLRTTGKQETYFSVREIERKLEWVSPADIRIEIHNPKLKYWYSVTIVAPGEYTGTADFLREVKDRPGNPLLYSWIPKFRGDYEIIVHELSYGYTGSYTPPLGDSYRFSVVDKPPYDSRQVAILNQIAKRPPCQTVVDRMLHTRWDGMWIGPHLHGDVPGMRTGWYFLPSRESFCTIEYFTDRELSMNPEEKSIYILGSSKERGVFLSLVDLLLDSKEKEQMNNSVISKCWGRAFVVKSNLKVLYQDWRSNYFAHGSTSTANLCHNDQLVREGSSTFTDNGKKVWEEIFQDSLKWPSVVLMSVGNNFGHDDRYDLQHFIDTLPSTWKGTLLLTDGAFSAMKAGAGNIDDYERYRKRIIDLVLGFHDNRVRWIDGLGVSKEMRLYGELGPNRVADSQHFHSHCDSVYLDENGEEQHMKICSNVTEMLGQLLIGYALGPKAEYIDRIQQTGSYYNGNNDAMYCHACPEDLLPFHITPYPEMTCNVGPLHVSYPREVVKSPKSCPKACASIPATGSVQTQSGVVYERLCPLEYFSPPTPSETINEKMDVIMQMDRRTDQIDRKLPPVTVDVQRVEQEILSPNSEINNMDFINDYTSSSLYDTRLLNMVLFLILITCFQSKIKSLIRGISSNSRDGTIKM